MAGGLGSGKTEIALNMAFRAKDKRPLLADLDVVNPYFCSREMEDLLNDSGVEFIGPSKDRRLTDVPFIPPQIIGCLKAGRPMVLDVGGDEVGCAVLGYLSPYISVREYKMYLVLNPYRPFADRLEKVVELKEKLEKASRLRFKAVISNPNLNVATDVEAVLEGHATVKAFAAELGLPLAFLCVDEFLANAVRDMVWENVFPLKIYLRPQWLY